MAKTKFDKFKKNIRNNLGLYAGSALGTIAYIACSQIPGYPENAQYAAPLITVGGGFAGDYIQNRIEANREPYRKTKKSDYKTENADVCDENYASVLSLKTGKPLRK
jgi:hypothetical protein